MLAWIPNILPLSGNNLGGGFLKVERTGGAEERTRYSCCHEWPASLDIAIESELNTPAKQTGAFEGGVVDGRCPPCTVQVLQQVGIDAALFAL
jgi:hypothetical protein